MDAATVRNLREVRPQMERKRAGNPPQKRVSVSEMQRRRKARRARKAKAAAAIAALFIVEVLLAAAAGALVAAIAVPIARIERGYLGFGGEWVLVFAATVIAYHHIHRAVFKRLES